MAPSSIPVDLRERLEVLFWQEMTSYKTEDYLGAFFQERARPGNPMAAALEPTTKRGHSFGVADDAAITGQEQIKEHWREIICEWAFNLVDHFDLPRERVSVFTNLLDRYLQKYLSDHPTVGISKKHFQLLSLTCLYITIKMECHQGYLSMDMMIHLSRESFSKEQMVAMEKEIFQTLDWKVNPPTPFVFLQHFVLLLQSTQVVHPDTVESAKFLMELAELDYRLVDQRPSRIALAALLNTMEEKRMAPLSERFTVAHLAAQESQYNFLLSLIAPAEKVIVDSIRARLATLYSAANIDNDDMLQGQADPIRVVSPVSVVPQEHDIGFY